VALLVAVFAAVALPAKPPEEAVARADDRQAR
jgi:hypothetical protein